MKNSKIKVKKTKRLYKGRWLSLDVVDWELGGRKRRNEVVIFPNTVGILPIFKKDKVVLVKQYRFPAKKELWEIPAGIIEKNEKPEKAARRELEEETGFKPGRMIKMAGFYPSSGYTTEYLHLFKTNVSKRGKQSLDETELINKVKIFDLRKVSEMIKKRKIIDAKTIIAVELELLARPNFKNKI